MRRKWLLGLVFVAYMVGLLEIAARIAFALPNVNLWSETDTSWRRSWYQRHEGKAEIYYRIHVYDPTKGWRTAPSLRNVQGWGLVGVRPMTGRTLSTNSWGFRGSGEIAPEKEPGKVRILLLGDSFTFGDEVSDHETFAYYLQQTLPGAEVINAGVSGYGHDQMLIMLSELAPELRPDIVILGFLQMDMERNRLGFRDFAKPRFVVKGDDLQLRSSTIPPPEDVLRWERFRPRLFDLDESLRYRYRTWTGREQELIDDITMRLLREIVTVTGRVQSRAVFAYLPAGEEISASPMPTNGERFFTAACTAIPDAVCVNTRPEFGRRLAQGEVFERRGHWAANGHRAVAAAISGFLVDGGYVGRSTAQ